MVRGMDSLGKVLSRSRQSPLNMLAVALFSKKFETVLEALWKIMVAV